MLSDLGRALIAPPPLLGWVGHYSRYFAGCVTYDIPDLPDHKRFLFWVTPSHRRFDPPERDHTRVQKVQGGRGGGCVSFSFLHFLFFSLSFLSFMTPFIS